MSLTISHATSLNFRIEQGAGSQNENAGNIPNNYLFTDVKTFFNAGNCEGCLTDSGGYKQKYTTSDTVTFQIDYNNGTVNPRPIVRDENGNAVEVLELVTSSGGQINYQIDFTDSSKYSAENCYYVEIWSDLLADEEAGTITNNLFIYGDYGRHEAGISNLVSGIGASLNNTIVQSAAQQKVGANSALITAPGTPTADHKLIYANAKTSLITLTAGKIYRALAYVYVPSTGNWVAGNNINLSVNFNGGFGDDPAQAIQGWTDATILKTVAADASNTDVFQAIEVWFQCNTDTTGSLVIYSDNIPNANGEIYVDTVSINVIDNILEATSEPIKLADTWPCHQKLTWTNAKDAHNLWYNAANWSNTVYVEARYHEFRFEDEDDVFYNDDEGNSGTGTINSEYVALFKAKYLPPYMMEKIILGMKHDTFKINGVQYVARNGNINPNFDKEESTLSSVVAELNLTPYKYQRSSC